MRKLVLLFSMILLACFQLAAQDHRVSGTVTGPDGEPVGGVTVAVVGTTNVILTEPNGQYSIVASANATLEFAFLGMATQTIPVGNRTVINVTLSASETMIDRVVVTALGMTKSEKALTYSANQVDAGEIVRGGERSLLSAVQGRFAGVNISTSSGAPGASNRIVLRGYRSIGGTNEPLWVVDGVPITNGVVTASDVLNGSLDFGNRGNDINPDDIASMSILKGSGASALYGSRAANGVIIITTKSGRFGKGAQDVRVEYSNDTKFTRVAYLPQMQNRFGQGWNSHDYLDENGSWGPKFTGEYRLWGHVIDGYQQYKRYVALPSNIKDFFNTGINEVNSVNISGGNEASTFFMSYSNTYSDGVLPGDTDNLKRNAISARGTTTGKILSASASINYVNKKVSQAHGGQGLSVFNDIMQIPRDLSLVDMKNYHGRFYTLDDYFTGYGVVNPYYSMAESGNTLNEDHVFGSIQLTGKITHWLTATVRAGNDFVTSQERSWRPIAHSLGANFDLINEPGEYREITRYSNEFNGDAFLQFNPTFVDDNLSLSGILGYNINARKSNALLAAVEGLDIPGFYDLANSASTPSVDNSTSMRRMIGLYFNADLDWKSMVFLNLAMRNDWSSTLPKNNRSFFSPSVGISASLTDIFPSLRRAMTFAKIRASYGETGNDPAPYSLESVYVRGAFSNPFGDMSFPIGGVNGYEFSNTIGSATLRPERTKEFEVGLDFRFLQNRLGLDVSYYTGRSIDQILAVPMAASTGFTTQLMNIGIVSNKGIEIALSTTPIRTDEFQWDVNFTFARNRNKVIKLAEGLDRVVLTGLSGGTTIYAVEGKPLGVYMGNMPMQVRVDENGNEVTSGGTLKTVVGANGIPILTTGTPVDMNADIEADFTAGVSTTITWRGLSLSALIDGRKGGYLFSRTADINYFVGNAPLTIFNDRQPFVVPNSVQRIVDPNNQRPTHYFENNTPVTMELFDDFFNVGGFEGERSHLVSRTNIRLREVVLSYALPQRWFVRGPVRGMSVSLIGHNLLLWRPAENRFVDPETSTFGNNLVGEFGEFSGHPATRVFGFNIKASF